MTSGPSPVGARRLAGFAALVLTLLVAGALPLLAVTARQGTPKSASSDPCAEIVAAAGTPAAEGGGGMGALDPIPGQQTGELGNPADYPFDLILLDAMIAHHEGAVLLAEIALVRAEHEELRGLARAIGEAQGAEIAELSAWRAAWYPDADPVPTNVLVGLMDEGLMQIGGPADMGGGPSGGTTNDAFVLCTAGDGFDLTFIDLMIPRHQSAVGMALLAQQRAEHPELHTLAEAIIAGLEAEIALMTAWRDAWAAAGAGTPAAAVGHAHGGTGHGDVSTTAPADDTTSPYAGNFSTSGTIRSLTPEQVAQIERGEGAGFALPAELNGLPGPRHVLDLAADLALSPAQLAAVEAIYAAMRAEAIAAGARYLAALEALETDLRTGSIAPEELPDRVAEVSRLEGDLIAVHLVAHLQTAALLSPEQIAAYQVLRGYE